MFPDIFTLVIVVGRNHVGIIAFFSHQGTECADSFRYVHGKFSSYIHFITVIDFNISVYK